MIVRACAVSIAAIAAAAVLGAQDPQRPIFRAKVDAVTLDVTVTDKSGALVTDLTPADFVVTEQGKPQAIETFELVDMNKRPAMDSNVYHEIRTLQSQEQELARKDSRLFVIFLDDYHVRLRDQWQVRNQLADVVSGIDPRDLVALMYPLMPVNTLTFTRDHVELARQIEKFEGRQGMYYPPKGPIEENHIRAGNVEKRRRDVVRTALAGLCTFLGTVRESRKSVLLVGGWAPGGFDAIALDDFKQVQRAAARSNTAIYTWDPQGLLAAPPWRSNDWLITLADQTGGQATVNTNNGRVGMRRMLSDSESYYQIGYTSTENVHDGKFHDVKVTVTRKDLSVRARPGYWAYDAEAIEKAAGPPPPPVDAAINAALGAAETPEQGRPMLTWAGFDRDASGEATVNVVWESHDTRTPIAGAEVTAIADAGSFRGRGKAALSFPAKPGQLSIRIAGEDAGGNPVETNFVALTVPEPAPIQIATPAFIKGRTMRLVTAAGALPTASREFTKLDQVIVRVHAFADGASPVVIRAKLLSDRGDAFFDLEAQPDAAAPGVSTIALPIGGLGLGRYVVEITATSGPESAKVLTAFKVK